MINNYGLDVGEYSRQFLNIITNLENYSPSQLMLELHEIQNRLKSLTDPEDVNLSDVDFYMKYNTFRNPNISNLEKETILEQSLEKTSESLKELYSQLDYLENKKSPEEIDKLYALIN